MNDDLISRQRLLKELKHHKELFCRNRIQFLGLSKNDKARVDEIDNCYAMVINVPPAQPERKKGCKIVKGTGTYGYCACDQCGKPVHPEDKFCSNCGADFREDT